MKMEGVMEMLQRLGINLRGKHACVIGCSDVVGLPMALMLMAARHEIYYYLFCFLSTMFVCIWRSGR